MHMKRQRGRGCNRKQAKPIDKKEKLSSKDDNSSDTTTISTTGKTVYDLPEEVLLIILQYLGHGDVLTSRLVNKTWNKTISNYHRFPSTKMIYLIKIKLYEYAENESQITLKRSAVPWKRLRLEGFSVNARINQRFILPLALSSAVASLELSESVLSWDSIRHILVQFQALEEFNIVKCSLRKSNERKNPPKIEFQERLVNSVKDLKSISITLELERIADMASYIKELTLLNVSNLVSISLQEYGKNLRGRRQDTEENAEILLGAMLTFIRNSYKTLKSLRINFGSFNVINNIFPEVVENLIGRLDLHTFSINSFTRFEATLMERDMDIFARFIQSQNNLKEEIHLPRTNGAKQESWTKILQSVNNDIGKIHIRSCIYVQEDFLDHFAKLSNLTYEYNLERILEASGKDSYPNMRTLQYQNYFEVKLMVLKFPNLISLTLDSYNDNMNTVEYFYTLLDSDLQTIIQHLKKLKYLVLGNCCRISDFGISGVKKEYCAKIFSSLRSSRCHGDSKVKEIPPKNKVDGSPISSLTGLTHLTMKTGNEFTDVGIFFGFRFQELRRLSIEYSSMKRNDCITDRGLECLAKWNPDLDYAYLVYGDKVTHAGLQKVKTHLRRIMDKNLHFVQNPLKVDG